MNIQCRQYREVLSDLLAGSLSSEREAEVQRHLSGCEDCRAFLEALQADDALLAGFTDAMRPAVAGIEAAVLETLTRDAFEPVLNPAFVTTRFFKASRVTYAAAAIVVLALLLLAGRALLPSDTPAIPLAQTLEAMRSQPWIHVVQTSSTEEGPRREYWENFDARVRASRMPDGRIVYANYAENVSYAYNPDANGITVSSTADLGWNPFAQLTEAIGTIHEAGAELSRSVVVEDGVRLERIGMAEGNDPGSESVVYVRDAERNLLVRVETVVLRDGQEERHTAVYDYPERGPEDIYALGAPRSAAVLDVRQEDLSPDESIAIPAATFQAMEPNASTPTVETEPIEPNAVEPEAEETLAGESSGRVTDEQGRPIEGATVLLYHRCSDYGLDNRVVERTQTGTQGSFQLDSPLAFVQTKSHAFAQDSYVLIALHPGYAFGWRNITQGQKHDRFDLVLTAGKSRTITVVDHEGTPLPGARVWLFSAGDRKSANPLFRDYLSLPTEIDVLGSVTDADGIAVVGNLPETGCSFHATLAGYATGLAFPGQNRIRLSPGATVSGWVLTESDEPVSGAVVRLKTEWMWDFYTARSNEEGYFSLVDLPGQGWDMGPWGSSEGANGQYTLMVKHDLHAGRDRKLQLLPGERIDDMVVRVSSQSTRVTCLVLEEGTDEPVAGARISGENAIGRINGYSDADGVFSVLVLPGPTSLTFQSPPDGVYVGDRSARGGRVSFEASGREIEVVLKSPPIEGRLVDVSGVVSGPEGSPVANVVIYAAAGRFHSATAGSYVRPAGADLDGRFELKEVPAGRDLCLYAETKDHRLVVTDVVPIPADANGLSSLELILKPTESAVVVLEDQEGNLAPDLSIELQPMVGGEKIWPAARRVRTDSLGVLDTDGIAPGLSYFLRDARFDETGGRLPDDWEKWFKREMVLLPLEP